MKLYADYAFYKSEYCTGDDTVIPESAFDKLAQIASYKVDLHTMQRLTFPLPAEVETPVKNAVCAVAEILHAYKSHEGLQSENVDGYSKTFAASDDKKLNRDIADAIVLYLGMTGLLYRGCGNG